MTASYTYDEQGIRSGKTINGVTTSFSYNGSLLMAQVAPEKSLLFSYDANGQAVSVNYNGTEYYYLRNGQNDIVGLMDESGVRVVEYIYDAWGKLISTTGTLATTLGADNPFRYRGYYYDTEIGLYYLTTRYYDPEVCRFISADVYMSTGQGVLGGNMWAYCLNNPVNRFDTCGTWSMPNWLKITIGVAAIAGLAIATACTGGAAAVVFGAALSGAISGGVSGAVMGAIGGGISGGWQGALDGACSGFMSGTLIGGVTGAASAGLNIATGATTVVGNAHGSTLHRLATNMEAGKMAASGQYSRIGMNRALKTMGLNGTSRPDVIGVAKKGMNKLVEVVSPKQSTNSIINKMSKMLSNNPRSVGKIVKWVRRLFEYGAMKLIPKKIQPYFKMIHQINDNDNSIIEGMLTCCNAHDFDVFVVGEVRHGMFSKICLFPENGKILIEVRCRKCGKVIQVFDSSCDGYEKCWKAQYTHAQAKPIDCRKCQNGGFSVRIKYEYPAIQELAELGIAEMDNAFTWIWITIECNNCKTKYKNFVDCETA